MEKAILHKVAKKVEEALFELDEMPLLRAKEEFSLKKFSKKLAGILNLPSLEIEIIRTKWKHSDQLLKGLGEAPEVISCLLSPIEEEIYCLMGKADIKRLLSWTLTKQTKKKGFTSPLLQEGFFRFLLLEALQGIEEMEEFP